MIERHFTVPFVAALALREKQIQQNYRPIIAVHKWFARRPGTLFRSLLLSEFGGAPVYETFYRSNRLDGVRVLDPFMGGGTTVLEANRLGCDVTGFDINPMAWWIVRQEIADLDLEAYQAEAARLREHLAKEQGALQETRCLQCGDKHAKVKYFLWVKTASCVACRKETDLFPNFLIAEDARHTANVFYCVPCGALYEAADRKNPGPCPGCGHHPAATRAATRNRATCHHCQSPVTYPSADVPTHRLFAMEYHCETCFAERKGKGRLFKVADAEDIRKIEQASRRLKDIEARYIPGDKIPAGDETERLLRWGYQHYRDLFNDRQLLGLELSCRYIAQIRDRSVREALATNLSDLLRYQNMLCRYDTMALKSLDVFSVHGFPVGLIQCESNFLGIAGKSGAPVGSGGWLNITEKYAKAKRYCTEPFEIRQTGARKQEVPIPGEWIGIHRANRAAERAQRIPVTPSNRFAQSSEAEVPEGDRQVSLNCADSSGTLPPEEKFDAVFTDPPYYGNVQYAELMDFCYVWLRKLLGGTIPEFKKPSTRHANELTGNVSMGRGLDHFADGLARTFRNCANHLKAGRPLAFTYHHNRLDAYAPVAMAILDSGLTASASIPCPAEMGASIHINGTGSSIVDTVFVCRSTGSVPRRWVGDTAKAVASMVGEDVDQLAASGLKATQGDIRCLAFGHLTRLAIWHLRKTWDTSLDAFAKMARIQAWWNTLGGADAVLLEMQSTFAEARSVQVWTPETAVRETYRKKDEISF